MVNLYRMRQLMRTTIKIRWKVEREMARATKTTTVLTGMPRGGGNKSQVENGAIQLEEIKAAYAETLGELERMQRELDPLLDALDNPDDRAAMRLRYIKCYSPEDIADAIHKTDRSIYYYLKRSEIYLAREYPEKIVIGGIQFDDQRSGNQDP